MAYYIRSTLAVFVIYEATIQLFSGAVPLERDEKNYSISKNDRNQFEKFLKEHGKTYGTREEKEMRLKIFQNNLKIIDELNARDEGTAVFGVTQFADLTMTEFKTKYGMEVKQIVKYMSSWRTHKIKEKSKGHSDSNAPMRGSNGSNSTATCKDWTAPNNPYMTPVKTYGDCVASWVMGPVDAMEISYSAKVKQITPLSAQQVIDCSAGNHCSKVAKISKWEGYFDSPGLVAETDYHWVGKKKNYTCQLTSNMKILAKGKINEVKGDDPNAGIIAALETCPVVTTINSAGFPFYKKGIIALDDSTCGSDDPDNLVAIVGCGTEKTKNGTLEYWIVKNQMGAEWGEQGFMRIKKGCCATGLYHFYFPLE